MEEPNGGSTEFVIGGGGRRVDRVRMGLTWVVGSGGVLGFRSFWGGIGRVVDSGVEFLLFILSVSVLAMALLFVPSVSVVVKDLLVGDL